MNENLFEIGDEVLCVDSSIQPENMGSVMRNFPIWIKKGEKYIVRDILYNDDIAPAILLQGRNNPEIYIPLLKRMQEPGFATWRFVKERSAFIIKEEQEAIEDFVHEREDKWVKDKTITPKFR